MNDAVKRKIVNTGHISFLKAKGYRYKKNFVINKDGKKIVEFIFTIPRDDMKLCDSYWQGAEVSAIDFKRELDSTHQEIEDSKNNWNSVNYNY